MRNFKEFSQLTEVAKYGGIDMKNIKTYEDALNPEVYVFNIATYSLSIIKRMIAEKKDIVKCSKSTYAINNT